MKYLHVSDYSNNFCTLPFLFLSASLSVWGYADTDKWGCPDKSDIVKDMNTDTPEDPCGGETYTSPQGYSYDVTWDWFLCHEKNKCIHSSNRCNLHPHPECIYMNRDGEMVGEDEEGCLEDYKTNGLVAPSATFPCQSETHNKLSPAILATFYNQTIYEYVYNATVIMEGVIVNILSTRCDGISECLDAKDEYGCGIKRWLTFLAGNSYYSFNFVYCKVANSSISCSVAPLLHKAILSMVIS